MTSSQLTITTSTFNQAPASPRVQRRFETFRRLMRNKSAAVGLGVLAVMVIIALLAPYLTT